MLDLSYIREHSDELREALKIRAPKLDFDAFLRLDAQRRESLSALEALRAEKNQANDKISILLKEKKDCGQIIASMKSISQKIGILEQKDRKSTRLNSSHSDRSRMPSSA